MTADVDFAAEIEADGRVAVKVQAVSVEVNIRLNRTDVEALSGIQSADWAKRGSILAGECAGARVFWSADADVASILVGTDDETWDVGVMIPTATVLDIARDARALLES